MPTPDLAKVYDALRKADAAGNTADAKRLADYIRSAQGAPTAPEPEQSVGEKLRQGFLDLAAQRPGEGPIAAAIHAAGNVVPGAQQLAAALDPTQSYAESRVEQETRGAQGATEHPVAAGVGTGAAIIAQLGGPKGVYNLLKASPQIIRGLVSKGVLSWDAVAGALKGMGAAAGYGAATSDADISLAEGRPGEAAGVAFDAATNPIGLALGATLGGAVGAAGNRLARRAAETEAAAEKIRNLQQFNADTAAHPERVAAANTEAKATNTATKTKYAEERAKAVAEARMVNEANRSEFDNRQTLAKRSAEVETARLRAEAEAAAKQVTPDNAARVFGLDLLPGRTAGATKARSIRLMNEPVPGGDGETWMAANRRFGKDVEGWQGYVEETKGALGKELGGIREQLTKVEGAQIDAQVLKEKLKASLGPDPTERAEKSLANAIKLVDDATKTEAPAAAAPSRRPSQLEFTDDSFGEKSFSTTINNAQGQKVGTLGGRLTDIGGVPALQVQDTRIFGMSDRGRGYAIKAYENLANEALESGKILVSDDTITNEAAKLYEALAKRGFTVEKNPLTRETATGFASTTDMPSGVFRVTKGPKAATASVATDGRAYVPAAKLRQIIKNLEEGKAWRLRGAAVDIEKRLVAQHLPEQNGTYRKLLNQWSDANELAQGAEKHFKKVNRGSEPIRFDKAATVEPIDVAEWNLPGKAPAVRPSFPPKPVAVEPNLPTKPEFPGGPEAKAAAEELLKPKMGIAKKFGEAVTRASGGALGAGLASLTGVPFLGYGGAAAGYQSGGELAHKWFQAVRPTMGGIIDAAPAAQAALAKWGPHLDAALAKGPRAVRSLHRALMSADPEYKDLMDTTGRSEPKPLSFGEFSSSWKGQ